jgi:hypothetical protein
MLAEMTAQCVFGWDEPDGCTTPRGWCFLENHPDTDA